MDPSEVTVVIPCRNRAHTLPRAIDSVLRQTSRPLEIIVVDDASSDSTGEVLNRYRSEVRILTLDVRSGAAAARNRGIQASRGSLVAFLDSDDEWFDHKIASQLEFFSAQRDSAVGIFSWAERRRDGRKRSFIHAPGCLLPSAGDLALSNVVGGCSSVIAKKAALLAVGGFDEALPASQDWDLWMRLVEIGPIIGQPAVLYRYFDHRGQISGDVEAVYRGRSSFFLKHRHKLESSLGLHDLAAWHRNLFRLALLSAQYEQALSHQRDYSAAAPGVRGFLRLLFVASRHAPQVTRAVLLWWRRFRQGI